LVTSSYDLDDIIQTYGTYDDMTLNDDKTLSARLFRISDTGLTISHEWFNKGTLPALGIFLFLWRLFSKALAFSGRRKNEKETETEELRNNHFFLQKGHSAKIKNGIFFKNDLQSGHRTVDPWALLGGFPSKVDGAGYEPHSDGFPCMSSHAASFMCKADQPMTCRKVS
jgi:hypothetical protein